MAQPRPARPNALTNLRSRLVALARQLVATEPAVLVGTAVSALALLGVTAAEGTVATWTRVLVVVLPLLAGGVTRQLVTPPANLHEIGPHDLALVAVDVDPTASSVETTAPHGSNPELDDEAEAARARGFAGPPDGLASLGRKMLAKATTLTTSALRRLWAPACGTKGSVYLAAYGALDACLRAAAYAPRAKDTGAYNCRTITGGTGYSLHAYGPGDRFKFWNGVSIATSLAVDINWTTNPYGPRLVTDMPRAMVDAILAIRTNNGVQVWRWGGDYTTNRDAMHFEIVCSPADLATGIAGTTAPAPTKRRLLRRGSRGPDVIWTQTCLQIIARKWPAHVPLLAAADGVYGSRTEAAVLAFQKMHNAAPFTTVKLHQSGVATIPAQDWITWWAQAALAG